MIIADTNTIAYLYLPSNYSADCEKVLSIDSDWAAPILWRSELRNILAVYMRRELISLVDAIDIQRQAELLLNGSEYEVDSLSILKLAEDSGCSAYDCEFVGLAQQLGVKLVTQDKKVLLNFPDTAVSMNDFLL